MDRGAYLVKPVLVFICTPVPLEKEISISMRLFVSIKDIMTIIGWL
jgi:hypothetical protein